MSSPLTSLFLVLGLWFGLTFGCCASGRVTPPPQLTTEHRNAISSALRAKGYPLPVSLEVTDGGFLVATFEIDEPVDSLQRFAEDRLLVIRNTMLPFHVVNNYRVTLNGPSPGQGLIRRYGVARFIEGGSVTWEPAK
jgi:hypothetical protein